MPFIYLKLERRDNIEYPKIIDKDNNVLAILNNLEECTIKETINGSYTLSFIATVDDLKTQYLYDEDNLIEVNNDLFRALIIEELHSENNELTVSVDCEHISYDLLSTVFDNFSYSYKTATEVMVECLKGTDFIFTGTDVTLKTYINYLEECNAKQISVAIANNWKGELQYHRYNIHLWDKRGQVRGVDFRFGKNIKGITKTTNRAKKDDEGNPIISYEIDVVELKHIEEYKDLEYFELGDTVHIIDDMLGIDTNVRIVERTYNVLAETNESITLGNILDDIRGSISHVQDMANESKEILDKNVIDWDRIKDITNDLGNVITGKLEGAIKTGQNKIENSTNTMTWGDDGIFIHNQPSEELSTWAMKLTSAGLAISDSKGEDGAWIWSTLATGAGVVADSVVTGELSGITIDGVEVTGTNITGGTVNGAKINGGEINIANNFQVNKDGDLTTSGNVTLGGEITWLPENNPTKVQYSITGEGYWHDSFNTDDKFARYSYDGGASWTSAMKVVGDKGEQGLKGEAGTKGDKGAQGIQGSAAKVPSYITESKITKTTIESPTISGAVINGVTINGGTIYVGDKTTGDYIELSPNNPVKVWRNNVMVSSLGYSAIGGGNLTIYDRVGDKAFWAECLENGDFQLFFNNDNPRIPDPNHPGFFLPNPNTRKAIMQAGNVLFKGAVKFETDMGIHSVASAEAVGAEFARIQSQFQSMQISINSKASNGHSHSGYALSSHTHSGYANSYHRHTVGLGGSPMHGHSLT